MMKRLPTNPTVYPTVYCVAWDVRFYVIILVIGNVLNVPGGTSVFQLPTSWTENERKSIKLLSC